jgi:GNAT superfamily N-acetyltransferase
MASTAVNEDFVVRALRENDEAAIVRIDARSVGRRRAEFLHVKLGQAFADTGVALSLVAELDGSVVGFMLARVYYGEFGVAEPVAMLDVFGVHPDFRGRHVAGALLEQLRTNLLGLGIATLRTEVGWDSPDLIGFFQHEGFTPAPRFCLDLDVYASRAEPDASR